MTEEGAHIRVVLDTEQPISLSNFLGEFVGLANQYQRFLATEHPDLKGEAELFVKEVRKGSVEVDLISMMILASAPYFPLMVDTVDKAQILGQFVKETKERLSKYFIPGGRDIDASKSDLGNWLKTVQGIARDPNGSLRLEAAVFEDGSRQVRSAFQFTTTVARIAEAELASHKEELESKSDTDHERVLLRFVRPSIEAGKPGKKGGERGIIEKLYKRALPILYASELAEQRLRHELLQVEGNVFRMLFDVDVNVELDAAGKPQAYRIVQVHAVIDAPEDDAA